MRTLSILFFLVFLAACGMQEPAPNDLASKKKLLKEKKTALKALTAEIDQLKEEGSSTIISFTVDQTVVFLINEKNYKADPELLRSITLKTVENIQSTTAVVLIVVRMLKTIFVCIMYQVLLLL